MSLLDEPTGADAPGGETPSSVGDGNSAGDVSYAPVTDTPYYSDNYSYSSESSVSSAVVDQPGNPAVTVPVPYQPPAGGDGSKPPPTPPDSSSDDDEEGMVRMSFFDHLEELRRRLFYIIGGFAVAFLVSLTFCNQLWQIVSAPAIGALKHLHVDPPRLVAITPMEGFNVIWVKVPFLCSIFLTSPWILYQVWSFIAPGLYKRERRWAAPFVICSAGLFILGGLFAYFVAFRFGLDFLLGVGLGFGVTPMISIDYYFDLFVNVTLGIGLVFELPVLIFFLTLLRIVSPKFLISHSRYAILGIVILAAIVTPTPDVFNLLIFATPMVALFFLGVFASYMLVLNREGRNLPWKKILLWSCVALVGLAVLLAVSIYKFGFYFIKTWPFLVR